MHNRPSTQNFRRKSRKHHGRGTSVDQHHDLALTDLCRRHGRPLGVAYRREQPRLAGQQPRHKVTGIQQKLRLCSGKRFAHTDHHGGVCPVFAVADGVFRLHFGIGLRHLLHQMFGTDEPPQQAQIDPQQVGKASREPRRLPPRKARLPSGTSVPAPRRQCPLRSRPAVRPPCLPSFV